MVILRENTRHSPDSGFVPPSLLKRVLVRIFYVNYKYLKIYVRFFDFELYVYIDASEYLKGDCEMKK